MKTHPITPASLAWRTLPDGTRIPCSAEYGDVYHARAGALQQARHVFLHGNGLPQRWQAAQEHTILETGFGLGNNFLETWATWRSDARRCARLTYLSIEKHPLRHGDLAVVHAESEHGGLARQLVDRWPALTHDLHLLDFDGGRVRLMLALGDVADWLPALVAEVDTFYLDGFAPSCNPAMWEPQLLMRLGRLAAPGAMAATWSAAREVRDGLEAAGFLVERQPGFAGKREMTRATYQPRFRPLAPAGGLLRPALPGSQRHAVVIGAGLAGAAAAWGLAEQGWSCTVLDANEHPACGASGNPGGLFHGVVHAEDGVHARVHRAAALAVAAVVSPWIAEGRLSGCHDGLLRLDHRLDAASANRLIDALGLPPEHVRWLDRADASARAGLDLPSGGWLFVQGGWLNPGELARTLLEQAGARFMGATPVACITHDAGLWHARDAGAAVLASAPVLVLANGLDASRLLATTLPDAAAPDSLPLSAVRGQISLLPAGMPGVRLPRMPVAGAGYVLALRDSRLLCGATSQHGDPEAAVRPNDHRYNLTQAARLGAWAETGFDKSGGVFPGEALDEAGGAGTQGKSIDVAGRVGWRAVTPDRLPLVGAVSLPTAGSRLDQVRLWPRMRDAQGGLYLLTGLGSRGITWSVLAGRLLAHWVTGSPCPVPADLRDALDVARFAARIARGQSRS